MTIIHYDADGWTAYQDASGSVPGDRRLRVRHEEWPDGDHFVLPFTHLAGHLHMLDSAVKRGVDVGSGGATYPIPASDVPALRAVIRAALPAWVAAATAEDWQGVPAGEVFANFGALARLGIQVPAPGTGRKPAARKAGAGPESKPA